MKKGGWDLLRFIACFGNILLYTLGIVVACGLVVEGCYRLCFHLLGRRPGRVFWFATSWLGTPVHELGHALVCLVFCHRIERMRLFSGRRGVAMVRHSYSRKNVWATMGNLFIGLGPVFTGLAVILTLLSLVYPNSLRAFYATGAEGSGALSLLFDRMWRLFQGLLGESTRPAWARIIAVLFLFSVTLHVRLSLADVRGMCRGLPAYLVVCAAASAIVSFMGATAYAEVLGGLRRFGGTVLMLFAIILLFALLQLALVLIYRALAFLLAVLFARAPED